MGQPHMSTEQMKYLPQPVNQSDSGTNANEEAAFQARDLIPRTPYINR